MNSLAQTGRGIGLALMAVLYLWSGFAEKPFQWDATVAYAAANGLPWPSLAVAGSLLIEALVPMALLRLRWRPTAALILALYTLMTALLFHKFWSADPASMQNQLQHFLKNVALTGAWLYVFVEARDALRTDEALPVAAGLAQTYIRSGGRRFS